MKNLKLKNSKHNNENGNGKNTLAKRRREYKQRMCLFDHHDF